MTHDYLTDLNQEQRRAVKHGVEDGSALRTNRPAKKTGATTDVAASLIRMWR
jgi:hypothetical protein